MQKALLITSALLTALLLMVSSVEPANAALSCNPSGPSYNAREKGKEAFVFRMNSDLFRIVIENDPKHIDLYGKCVEALSTIDKIGALLTPTFYTNTFSLKAILNFVKDVAISAVCNETYKIAQEAYGEITDVLPMGAYVYDIGDIINDAF